MIKGLGAKPPPLETLPMVVTTVTTTCLGSMEISRSISVVAELLINTAHIVCGLWSIGADFNRATAP